MRSRGKQGAQPGGEKKMRGAHIIWRVLGGGEARMPEKDDPGRYIWGMR